VRKGLSLVEILIAASIMVAAMVPLWGLLGASHKQVTVSSDEVRASQIANEIIEQIENSNWFPVAGKIDFNIMKNSEIKIGTTQPLGISIGDYPDYLRPSGSVEIEKYPASGADVGRIVRLKISYSTKEKVGTEVKIYQVSTYIARK